MSFLKNIVKKIPAVRRHIASVNALVERHDRLSAEVLDFQKRLFDMTSDRERLLAQLVLFYGVFYHLRHPQLALERIRSICAGKLLFQTQVVDDPLLRGRTWARFCPYGVLSGRNRDELDPTVFWLFNNTCCVAMLEHVGFKNVKIISDSPNPFVVSAESPEGRAGLPPLHLEAPWC
jgi:hypothetical protein